MGLIEPRRFWPTTPGRMNRCGLPGYPAQTGFDFLRIAPGVTISRSVFSPAVWHRDDVVRPAGGAMIVLNQQGGMSLRDRDSGTTAHIAHRTAWLIVSTGKPMRRIVAKAEGCSNLVITVDETRLPQGIARDLRHLGCAETSVIPPFHRLELPLNERAACERIKFSTSSEATRLRYEGLCLMLVGAALEDVTQRRRCLGSEHGELHAILIERVCDLLATHLAEPVRLAALSRDVGVSHVTLNRVFRREMGMTVFEYLRELRLKTAQMMIAEGGHSLTRIVYDCGFSSPSHLSSAFRKRFGISPRTYRERIQRTFRA